MNCDANQWSNGQIAGSCCFAMSYAHVLLIYQNNVCCVLPYATEGKLHIIKQQQLYQSLSLLSGRLGSFCLPIKFTQ